MVKEQHCEEHSAHSTRLARLEKDIANLWEKINRVENRLPLWATGLFAVLLAALTGALSRMIK